MRTLEEELKFISELRRGLSADKVLQEEQGHYETMSVPNPRGWGMCDFTSIDSVYIRDKQRKTIPDEARREEARTDLQHLYVSSPHILARIAAGFSLGYSLCRIIKEEYQFSKP